MSNLQIPEEDLESRIVFSLERLSQALRTLLWDVAKEKGLSPIQVQFLLYINTHTQEKRRVSNLAEEFGLTQATVSDAIKVLLEKGLIFKETSETDGRVFNLSLTSSGRNLAVKLSGWQAAIKNCLCGFSHKRKEEMMSFLMELIAELQRIGVVNIARMCITCGFFFKRMFIQAKRDHIIAG